MIIHNKIKKQNKLQLIPNILASITSGDWQCVYIILLHSGTSTQGNQIQKILKYNHRHDCIGCILVNHKYCK